MTEPADSAPPSPPPSDPPFSPALGNALVAETGKKSSMFWLRYRGSDRSRPAWYTWSDGVAYLVAAAADAPDAAEQHLPGLAELTDTDQVTVTSRAKDGRERLVTWIARVEILEPETEEWQAAFILLRGARLNAADLSTLAEQWSRRAVIVRLTPTGELTEHLGAMPDASGAAPPPASPASTRARLPWVFHRRARRSPRLTRRLGK